MHADARSRRARTTLPTLLLPLLLAGCGAKGPSPAAPARLTGAEVYRVLPPDAAGGPEGCVYEAAAGDAVGCLFHRLDNGQYTSRFEAWSPAGKAVDVQIYAGWLEGFDAAHVDQAALERANAWLQAVGARLVDAPAAPSPAEPEGLPAPDACCAWTPVEARKGPDYTAVVFSEQCCFELTEGAEPPSEACSSAWASSPEEMDECEGSHAATPRRAVRFTARRPSP